jgi:excisionase family DNA binding protein
MTELPNKALLRPGEVAEYFSVTIRTIYNWIDKGKLEAKKVFGVLRVTHKSVEEAEKSPYEYKE